MEPQNQIDQFFELADYEWAPSEERCVRKQDSADIPRAQANEYIFDLLAYLTTIFASLSHVLVRALFFRGVEMCPNDTLSISRVFWFLRLYFCMVTAHFDMVFILHIDSIPRPHLQRDVAKTAYLETCKFINRKLMENILSDQVPP